jgi:hypothetical protein
MIWPGLSSQKVAAGIKYSVPELSEGESWTVSVPIRRLVPVRQKVDLGRAEYLGVLGYHLSRPAGGHCAAAAFADMSRQRGGVAAPVQSLRPKRGPIHTIAR